MKIAKIETRKFVISFSCPYGGGAGDASHALIQYSVLTIRKLRTRVPGLSAEYSKIENTSCRELSVSLDPIAIAICELDAAPLH